MLTLTVKNIPDDLYTQLKEYAAMNRRSLNSEIIVCIDKVIRGSRMQPDTLLARARKLREKTGHYPIGDKDLNEAKMVGRP